MTMTRRNALISAAALVTPAAFAQAQGNWPAGPIRVVVPTTAGGASDTLMRLLAQKMSESMKTPVIVDNKPGAGNVIGSDAVAKAPPDGYTLLLTYTDHVFNPFLHPSMPYDTARAFTPIGLIGSVPLLLAVNNAVPAKTTGEFIAMAKASPGTLNFASAGSGSSLHLAGELFKSMAGINVVHVPYKGTSPAFIDLIGGQVQFMFPTTASAAVHLQAGKIRALAITGSKRAPNLPNIPTVAESGLPGYEAAIWYGMLAPAGTPPAVVARLNTELNKAMQLPDVKAKLAEQGFVSQPGTPEDFGRMISAEMDRWGKLIREQNIKL
ncbi:MAG: tripartite tricarboxylate transporter substrate binding protein [Comamonadaceae bacterium]|nr:MAG: tripartite tricarboxylate transporter substrate binding protein [Comamonadaceae bacterium]